MEWGKCRLFSYIKIQTVAHIMSQNANAASFPWFIFHKGEKKIWCSCYLFPILPLICQTGRWAINSCPSFQNCRPCLWERQITPPALCVFSLWFSGQQLMQGKCLSPLWAFETLPWGRDCKSPGWGVCKAVAQIVSSVHWAFRCYC